MVIAAKPADSEVDDSSLVLDSRGNPADKSKTGGWVSAGLILVAELAERLCVMGISFNLVTYIVGDLHLSNSASANIVTNFLGTLYLLALLSGFLSDAKLGRYLSVLISAIIATAGVALLTVATTLPSLRPPPCSSFHHDCEPASSHQLIPLYLALYITALGAGGIKANVSGFGTDQFDSADPVELKSMVFFFNRFYFCISLGSLFAATVLVYLQDNVGRDVGYGVSAAAMAAAVAFLLAGTPLYRYRKPQGSPLAVLWRVIFLAWKNRKEGCPSDASSLHEYHISKVPHTDRYRWLDKAAMVLPTNTKERRLCSVTEVEETKMVMKLIPIWSTCILFWTVYSQMTTFSVEQATTMDRKIGSFMFPAGSLSFFLFATILLFTSLNERLLIPISKKITGNSQGLTSLQRVGVGLFFSILAMATAAVVEFKRREYAVSRSYHISALWLVPQFFLVGAGEAFAYVGQLEFFIREAPERMKSMSTGLFLATLSMGFFLSSLLVSLVGKITGGKWIKNDLNEARLDYFYWMLAVLGLINFVVFLGFSRRHQYNLQQPQNLTQEAEEKGFEIV